MRLGSDPEVFLCDINGEPVSAIGLINADKWSPLPIAGMPDGFTLQEDNVALEYGIPPAATEDEFVYNIQAVMAKSREWIGNLTFSKLSCTIFPKKEMEHPAAHVFGCEPDFNAWTKKTNEKPQPPHEFMRSAGGHIHVETKRDPFVFGRYMDLCLGVPAVILDKDGLQRKQLYGKKGAIRPKPYGVEYRVLSNFWIFDEQLIRWAWRATHKAEALYGKVDLERIEHYLDIAINQNDEKMAWSLIDDFQLTLA